MGNFSRDTFDKLKNYVGVRLQQGVPLIDADWNELEDIRKYELQTFIKWFIGDGVPKGNDGFRIVPIPSVNNDFVIQGGNGTAEGAGRCLVEGWEVMHPTSIRYMQQTLFTNPEKATEWNKGKPDNEKISALPALTVPAGPRTDLVYLDVWEREVNALEDDQLVNPLIGLETCVRLKREWVVRVVEDYRGSLPAEPVGHAFYSLARLLRNGQELKIEDIRRTGLTLAGFEDEIADARGMKANLGNRLDESLTAGGQLRQKIVGRSQFTVELENSYHTIESHLSNTANPHHVTAAQAGALPLSAYELDNRQLVSVSFSPTDANGAQRTINVGFKPRFIWSMGSANALLGGTYFGVNSYGFADLKDPAIQLCTCEFIQKMASAPYWSKQPYQIHALYGAQFQDASVAPIRKGTLSVVVSAVSDTGITVMFGRDEPSGTGTTYQKLDHFWLMLQMLVLG
ncbi:MAG: hypothetical protein A4E62_00027 [Syntrophorhabdus sp. PtaU1.Bin002]|nr:MAG: hypothetical protein A4E62_00027 [Syntrophorhabdus sp. PtaU1.Bin002]